MKRSVVAVATGGTSRLIVNQEVAGSTPVSYPKFDCPFCGSRVDVPHVCCAPQDRFGIRKAVR